MIAKIGRSKNLYGSLSYNQLKVQHQDGRVLMVSNGIETPDGNYSVAQLAASFATNLTANRNTEKPVLHISLNPDPKDKVSNEQFCQLAQEYMQEMGYGKQPFIVFKHTDTSRVHIHIVSVCVDENGRKISDKFGNRRSMNVCRQLEHKYGLIRASNQEYKLNEKIFRPVEYRAGDVKSQIASVIRHLPKYYQFQTLGEYNALLSLFNLTSEKVEGPLHGRPQQGLLYIPLDEHGERLGHSFKASLFGKNAGFAALASYFAKCKTGLKDHPYKKILQAAVTTALQMTKHEVSFKQHLADQGINVIVRRNESGRIYGITFIDHTSGTVWNGSRLGKEFSANTFNETWNKNTVLIDENYQNPSSYAFQEKNPKSILGESKHELFEFLEATAAHEKQDDGLFDSLAALMPTAQGDDYEELQFAKRIRKKRGNDRK